MNEMMVLYNLQAIQSWWKNILNSCSLIFSDKVQTFYFLCLQELDMFIWVHLLPVIYFYFLSNSLYLALKELTPFSIVFPPSITVAKFNNTVFFFYHSFEKSQVNIYNVRFGSSNIIVLKFPIISSVMRLQANQYIRHILTALFCRILVLLLVFLKIFLALNSRWSNQKSYTVTYSTLVYFFANNKSVFVSVGWSVWTSKSNSII